MMLLRGLVAATFFGLTLFGVLVAMANAGDDPASLASADLRELPWQRLSMGLKAAPPLVAALQEKTIGPEKRAWILSLLYSVTGENDARYEDEDALGSYKCIEGPWQVLGGAAGESPSGGLGDASEGSSWGGKIDVQAQQDLANKRVQWLKTVKLIASRSQ